MSRSIVAAFAFSLSLPSISFAQVNGVNGTSLANAGFNQPPLAINAFVVAPASTSWTYVGSAGVTDTASGFTSGNTGLKTGQLAFVQNTGSISQQVTLVPGSHKVYFWAARRVNYQFGTQILRVKFGNTIIADITPDATLRYYETPAFNVSSQSTQALTISGVGSGSDYTAFVDDIAIRTTSSFGFLWSNNVRLTNPSPLLIDPVGGAVNNPPSWDCTSITPKVAPNKSFSTFRAAFSYNNLICQNPSFAGNINPAQTVDRYVWAEGKDAVLTFNLNASYRGRGYGQPVFDIYHRDYDIAVHGTSKYTFYVNPQLFDGEDVPPGNFFADSVCQNGCTGKPLVLSWFGVANPYMGFGGTPSQCAIGNASTNTSCNLSNASLTLTRAHITAIVNQIVAVSDCSNPNGPKYYCGNVNPDDWRINTYAFDFEMPPWGNSFLDATLSNVSFTTPPTAQPPTATVTLNGVANGSATIPHMGSFTLSYSSQNANRCDLVATQNGAPWYSYANYGLSYNWGTVSGWGGPATYRWTVTCFNAAGQSATSSANLTISGPVTPIDVSNGGFESPALSTYQYAPAGAGWTFSPASGTGGSGIARNGSAFTVNNPGAPEGSQVAFIQGDAKTVWRNVNVPANGQYRVRFRAAQRAGNANNLQVKVKLNSTNLGTITPSGTGYIEHTTATAVTLTAGSRKLEFISINPNPANDNSLFIDKVQLIPQ